MSGLVASSLPPVSAEFITELEKAFPAPTLEPGFDRDKALWAAAQHDVVKWMKNKVGITHKQAVTNEVTTRAGANVRFGHAS